MEVYKVLRPLRVDEPCVVDRRAERDTGYRRSNRQYLAWLPVLVCDMPRVESGYLACRGHAKGPTGCGALGSQAVWYSVPCASRTESVRCPSNVLSVALVDGWRFNLRFRWSLYLILHIFFILFPRASG